MFSVLFKKLHNLVLCSAPTVNRSFSGLSGRARKHQRFRALPEIPDKLRLGLRISAQRDLYRNTPFVKWNLGDWGLFRGTASPVAFNTKPDVLRTVSYPVSKVLKSYCIRTTTEDWQNGNVCNLIHCTCVSQINT